MLMFVIVVVIAVAVVLTAAAEFPFTLLWQCLQAFQNAVCGKLSSKLWISYYSLCLCKFYILNETLTCKNLVLCTLILVLIGLNSLKFKVFFRKCNQSLNTACGFKRSAYTVNIKRFNLVIVYVGLFCTVSE